MHTGYVPNPSIEHPSYGSVISHELVDQRQNLEIPPFVAVGGGSVSAEHGVGLLKKDYLPYGRSAAEIELMRQIKRVFDPNGVMNPGKIFD